MSALTGVRVLDLSRLAPGPYCTMLLGDMGADVLLIEQVGDDPSRPRARAAGRDTASERSRAYNALGRNKRSLALNLKDEAGRAIFLDLARTADVVVEGFRPGVVARLGVDDEAVAAVNPRAVYLSLSGYGQSGPYAQLVGHDINYIAIGGALGLTGSADGTPAIPLNVVADFAGGGLMAAFAIVTALLARERTGRGQYIDLAMSDGVLSLLTAAASAVLAGGPAPAPGRHLLSGAAPHYHVYQCADGGWLSLGSLEPWFFANLCRALDREDLIARQQEQAAYPAMIDDFAAIFRTRTRDDWFTYLSQWDICAAPVLRLDEALTNAHHRARSMIVEAAHPDLGSIAQVGIAAKFSATPGSVRSTAPRPGEHTDAVLRDLGLSDERVAELRAAGVVA